MPQLGHIDPNSIVSSKQVVPENPVGFLYMLAFIFTFFSFQSRCYIFFLTAYLDMQLKKD